MLIAVAVLFGNGVLGPWTQTFCWIAIFFIASAAASSAYLTASEISLWRRAQWLLLCFMR